MNVMVGENGEVTAAFSPDVETIESFIDQADNSKEEIKVFCCNGKNQEIRNLFSSLTYLIV